MSKICTESAYIWIGTFTLRSWLISNAMTAAASKASVNTYTSATIIDLKIFQKFWREQFKVWYQYSSSNDSTRQPSWEKRVQIWCERSISVDSQVKCIKDVFSVKIPSLHVFFHIVYRFVQFFHPYCKKSFPVTCGSLLAVQEYSDLLRQSLEIADLVSPNILMPAFWGVFQRTHISWLA